MNQLFIVALLMLLGMAFAGIEIPLSLPSIIYYIWHINNDKSDDD